MSTSQKDMAILIGIVLIAFSLRITTYKFYLMGHDPFHHFAIAEYINEEGGFPGKWPLSLFPSGATITEPMGLYYVSVVLHKLISLFGLSFFETYKLSTPLFGALTLVPVFFLIKHMFGSRDAFVSLIALALIPAVLYRTTAGFYRGDAFSVFFMVLGFYFFLTSLDGEMKNRLIRSVLAGISFGAMGLVWNGFVYGFVVISGFVAAYSIIGYIRGRDTGDVLASYAIAAGLGIVIIKYSILQQPHAQAFIDDLTKLIYPATLLFSGFLIVIGRVISLSHVHRAYLLAGALVISAAPIIYYFPKLLGRLMTGYGLVLPAGPLFTTITELAPTTQEAIWSHFYIASLLFIPGFFYLIRDVYATWNRERLFMLIWALASLYMLNAAVRYMFLAAIPITIISVVFLFKLDKTALFQKKRVTTAATVTALLVLIGSNGISFATTLGPLITDEWIDALNYLKEEEEGGVLVWWDYGSWVQGVTGFPTTLDTVTGQNQRRMKEIGRLLLEKDSAKIRKEIERYKVKYVVTSTDMIGQLPNIYGLLNTTGPNFVYYSYTGSTSEQGLQIDIYGPYRVYKLDGNRIVTFQKALNIYSFNRSYRKEGRRLIVSEVGTNLPSIEGAVYISNKDLYHPQLPSNFLLYIPKELEDSLLTSLIFLNGKDVDTLSPIYINSQVQIYKVK